MPKRSSSKGRTASSEDPEATELTARDGTDTSNLSMLSQLEMSRRGSTKGSSRKSKGVADQKTDSSPEREPKRKDSKKAAKETEKGAAKEGKGGKEGKKRKASKDGSGNRLPRPSSSDSSDESEAKTRPKSNRRSQTSRTSQDKAKSLSKQQIAERKSDTSRTSKDKPKSQSKQLFAGRSSETSRTSKDKPKSQSKQQFAERSSETSRTSKDKPKSQSKEQIAEKDVEREHHDQVVEDVPVVRSPQSSADVQLSNVPVRSHQEVAKEDHASTREAGPSPDLSGAGSPRSGASPRSEGSGSPKESKVLSNCKGPPCKVEDNDDNRGTSGGVSKQPPDAGRPCKREDKNDNRGTGRGVCKQPPDKRSSEKANGGNRGTNGRPDARKTLEDVKDQLDECRKRMANLQLEVTALQGQVAIIENRSREGSINDDPCTCDQGRRKTSCPANLPKGSIKETLENVCECSKCRCHVD